MAPIDIVINIIERHQEEARKAKESYPENSTSRLVRSAKEKAYKELVEEFERFKKLFS